MTAAPGSKTAPAPAAGSGIATETAEATAVEASARRRERLPYTIGEMTDGSRRLRASYDAAQTTSENSSHWAAADALSANAAHNPAVRAVLRFRARYEEANNSYCKGMLLTLANDVVGVGPTLQLLHPNREAANEIERKCTLWMRRIRLAQKLRTMRMTRARDGEVFGFRITNPHLKHPVKLDLRLVEADQVATPTLGFDPKQVTDGIVFDDYGNPLAYHVLKQHPGETLSYLTNSPLDYDTIDAEHVVHLFRPERPAQTRGVPEITPALPLYAQLRRYTLATIAAAETAADIAGVITSNLPPDEEDDAVGLMAGDLVEIVRRALMVLPDGHDASGFKSEQPTTTYGDFKREIINEIARCLNMPYNVAAGNSSGYNYASGRLDHKVYYKSLGVDRQELELEVLEWLFEQWLEEASRIPGYLPLPDADISIPHEWFWPGDEHVDPAKEATAQKTRLSSLTTSLAREAARAGVDWEKELQQIAKEQALKKELGLAPAQPSAEPARAAADFDALIERIEQLEAALEDVEVLTEATA